MAAKEMYDYLSAATADYTTTTLDVKPHKAIEEMGQKKSKIYIGDDGSEQRVALSSTSFFFVTLEWTYLSESDAGTILDFYHDSAKGNGMARTFKWEHPSDNHTYVVRFDEDITRTITHWGNHGIKQIRLKVLGYVASFILSGGDEFLVSDGAGGYEAFEVQT